MKDMTSTYGDAFAYKLVKSFIESPTNFIEVESFVNPEAFETAGLGLDIVVKQIKEFYKDKGVVPGYADLEYYIKDNIRDKGDRNAAYMAFSKIKEKKFTDGMDIAAEKGIAYLKNLEAIRQAKNMVKSLETSGYSPERVSSYIEKLQSIENGSSAEWYTPGEMLEKVLNESTDERIPTYIEEIDKYLNGGIPKGTTNMLLAGTGVGKTTLFSIMACRESIAGKKVLYIGFEDKDSDFTRKFYSVITGRYTNDFYQDSINYKEASQEIREKLKKESVKNAFYNNIKVLRMDNGDTTVDNIKTKVRSMIIRGWKPDVVFIDYLSCIKPSTDGKLSIDKEYAAYERAIKRLDSFAQTEGFVLWVAQQFNREGCKFDSTYNRLGSIQGSYRVTQTASVILCLIRNRDDNDYNKVNIYLDKNRYGGLTEWEGSYLNNGTCQILLRNENVFETITKKTDEYDY